MACCEWKVPFLPVKPWQMTLVFLSIRMDILSVLTCAIWTGIPTIRNCDDKKGRNHHDQNPSATKEEPQKSIEAHPKSECEHTACDSENYERCDQHSVHLRRRLYRLDDLLRSIVEVVTGGDVEARLLDDLLAEFD